MEAIFCRCNKIILETKQNQYDNMDSDLGAWCDICGGFVRLSSARRM